jgi:hypothetical protein
MGGVKLVGGGSGCVVPLTPKAGKYHHSDSFRDDQEADYSRKSVVYERLLSGDQGWKRSIRELT